MICEELGWFKRERDGDVPDVTRLKRVLGIEGKMLVAGMTYATEIEEKLAIEILRAMDFDPVDFGL